LQFVSSRYCDYLNSGSKKISGLQNKKFRYGRRSGADWREYEGRDLQDSGNLFVALLKFIIINNRR
jgi:hypothetical protein